MSSANGVKLPHASAGLAVFFILVAIVIALAALGETPLLVTTPLIIVAVTLAAVFVLGVDARQTLLLRWPSAGGVVMAIPLALATVVVLDQLSSLSQYAFPLSEQQLELSRKLMTATTTSEWVLKIATICVGAAVSEELMFRGFILTAFRQNARRSIAILFSALLFMLLHPHYVPALAAGIVLAVVAVASGSIVIPILIHFLNNLSALLLWNVTGLETLGEPIWQPVEVLLPAVAIFVLALVYFVRTAPAETPQERPEPTFGSELPDPNDIANQRRERDRPLVIRPDPHSVFEELQDVEPGRRYLGFGVVALALVIGSSAIFGMCATSVYMMYPEQSHRAFIQVLSEHCANAMDGEGSEDGERPRVESAFQALAALNDGGQLDFWELMFISQTCLELTQDDELTSEEAEQLVATIRQLVVEKTGSKSL